MGEARRELTDDWGDPAELGGRPCGCACCIVVALPVADARSLRRVLDIGGGKAIGESKTNGAWNLADPGWPAPPLPRCFDSGVWIALCILGDVVVEDADDRQGEVAEESAADGAAAAAATAPGAAGEGVARPAPVDAG